MAEQVLQRNGISREEFSELATEIFRSKAVESIETSF